MTASTTTPAVAHRDFFAVRYFWRDASGQEQSHGSVAGGRTPSEALANFQAQNPHVRAELVIEAWQWLKPDGNIGTCAWCQKEQLVKPQPHESHGICPKHAAAMRADLERRRLAA